MRLPRIGTLSFITTIPLWLKKININSMSCNIYSPYLSFPNCHHCFFYSYFHFMSWSRIQSSLIHCIWGLCLRKMFKPQRIILHQVAYPSNNWWLLRRVGWVHDKTFCFSICWKDTKYGTKTDWLGQEKNYLLKTTVPITRLNTYVKVGWECRVHLGS